MSSSDARDTQLFHKHDKCDDLIGCIYTIEQHNTMFHFTVNAFTNAHQSRSRATYGLENPAPWEQYPSMFTTEQATDLHTNHGVKDYRFDQCESGLQYTKATQLLSSTVMDDKEKL